MHNLKVYRTLCQRELLLRVRKPAEWLNPLLFFVLVCFLFPMATTSVLSTLHIIGPGAIWVAVILACLMSMPSLFHHDFIDGSLEHMLLCPHSLPVLISIKVFAHWLFVALPLLVISPLMALMYDLNTYSLLVLFATLLLGTPTLMLLAAIAAALTTCLPHGGFLLALILLPMCLPLLIFATSAVIAAASGMAIGMPIALLAALFALTITLAPLAIAASLRAAAEGGQV